MNKTALRRRGHGFERLESRNMLAGNVKVEYMGSVLTFTGDSSSNSVYVQRINSTQIRVTGKTQSDSTITTKINGKTSPQIISFDGSKKSMNMGMGPGNDYIRLGTADAYKLKTTALSVKMGSGDDTIYVDNTNVYNSTTIQTDVDGYTQGKDYVRITNSGLGHEDGGNGTYYAYGPVSIKTGGASDTVILRNVFALYNITIDTARSGVDSAGDSVTLEDVRCAYDNYHHMQGTLKVTTGAGKDTISFTRVKSDFIEVYAKGGSDTVYFTSVLFDNDGSRVDGGSGVDKATRRNNLGDGLGDVDWVSFESFG